MPGTTPEMLAMARRIAFSNTTEVGSWNRVDFVSGKMDHKDSVRAALAAIKETTDRAIAEAESWTGADAEQVLIALRNGEHYHD